MHEHAGLLEAARVPKLWPASARKQQRHHLAVGGLMLGSLDEVSHPYSSTALLAQRTYSCDLMHFLTFSRLGSSTPTCCLGAMAPACHSTLTLTAQHEFTKALRCMPLILLCPVRNSIAGCSYGCSTLPHPRRRSPSTGTQQWRTGYSITTTMVRTPTSAYAYLAQAMSCTCPPTGITPPSTTAPPWPLLANLTWLFSRR